MKTAKHQTAPSVGTAWTTASARDVRCAMALAAAALATPTTMACGITVLVDADGAGSSGTASTSTTTTSTASTSTTTTSTTTIAFPCDQPATVYGQLTECIPKKPGELCWPRDAPVVFGEIYDQMQSQGCGGNLSTVLCGPDKSVMGMCCYVVDGVVFPPCGD